MNFLTIIIVDNGLSCMVDWMLCSALANDAISEFTIMT